MIEIPFDPTMFVLGGLAFTWHGFFAFVGVVAAVFLVGRWAPRAGIDSDVVYATAVWAIIGGVVGARVVHVIDRWDVYSSNPADILAIWNGGIALFGAIIGGFFAGALYARLQGYPIGRLADLTAPSLLIAQSIGRIGDIINGEHVSTATNAWYGFIYSHPASLSNQVHGDLASHPAILYEMVWNMAVLALLWYMWGRIKPDGMLFATYISLYSFGRFFITFLREDKIWFAGLQEAHLISIVVMVIAVPLLVYRGRLVARGEETGPHVYFPEGKQEGRGRRSRR